MENQSKLTNTVDFWVETDPSLQGWNARFENKITGGRWTHGDGVLHINILESLAKS